VAAITVDVTDLPGRLAEVLELARTGTEVLVTDAAGPVARLVPVGRPGRVIFGMHPGALVPRADFDNPITEEDFFRGDA
jgi:prevent-host-death family protein